MWWCRRGGEPPWYQVPRDFETHNPRRSRIRSWPELVRVGYDEILGEIAYDRSAIDFSSAIARRFLDRNPEVSSMIDALHDEYWPTYSHLSTEARDESTWFRRVGLEGISQEHQAHPGSRHKPNVGETTTRIPTRSSSLSAGKMAIPRASGFFMIHSRCCPGSTRTCHVRGEVINNRLLSSIRLSTWRIMLCGALSRNNSSRIVDQGPATPWCIAASI